MLLYKSSITLNKVDDTERRMIQRLLIPLDGGPAKGYFGGFGAGGNGGFSDEAFDTLSKIFNFDCMCAAEYEWGAVPEAMRAIEEYAYENSLTKNTLEVKEGKIFYICQKGFEGEVEGILKRILQTEAVGELGGSISNPIHVLGTGYAGLKEALENTHRKKGDLAGWIDLEGKFMFFVDRPMFEKTAGLFSKLAERHTEETKTQAFKQGLRSESSPSQHMTDRKSKRLISLT
jgi:hypothetical protein